MKSLTKLPTQENVLETLLKDAFGRNNDIVKYLSMLTDIEGHFVISIDGRWGTGKTFFVKQLKMVLDTINDDLDFESRDRIKEVPEVAAIFNAGKNADNLVDKLKKQKNIYFDAWSHDSEEDPISSILFTLVNGLSPLETVNTKNIIESLSKITKGILKNKVGFDIAELSHFFDDAKMEEASEEDKLRKYIIQVIESYIEKDERLILFIDELDRCKPSYAVKLLERIKHYFLLDNVTFVFSTNLLELSHTVNSFYGENFNGSNYLNRFFDLLLQVPQVNRLSYFNYLRERTPNSLPNTDYETSQMAAISYFELNMREQTKLLMILNAHINPEGLIKGDDFRTQGVGNIIITILAPFIVTLGLKNLNEQQRFLSGESNTELRKYLLSVNLDFFWKVLEDRRIGAMKIYPKISSDDKKEIDREYIITETYNNLFVNDSYDPTIITHENQVIWFNIKKGLQKWNNSIKLETAKLYERL